MSLGCLCGGLGAHCLCFTKQMDCTNEENGHLKKAEAWAHVEKLIAAWRDGSHSRGGAGTQSMSFSRFPTHDWPSFPYWDRHSRAGVNLGPMWVTRGKQTLEALLSLTSTATAAILCMQCLAPCLSIKSVILFYLLCI